MMDKCDRKSYAKRITLTTICVLLTLLLVAIVCAVLYANQLLNKINRVDPNLEYTLSSDEADSLLQNDSDVITVPPGSTIPHVKLEDITFPPVTPTVPTRPVTTVPSAALPSSKPVTTKPPLENVYGNHLVNIMLIGQDRRPGEGRQRSDSMILVSINKSNSVITLTSFMRDQYVQIPGYKPNKLNSAYSLGGMKLLSQTMELNFGVKVDGMVEVDFNGFENIITLLGGVKVTLTKKEAKYLNDLYDGRFLDSPVIVGENLLDAKQALVYARLREIDSDYHRAGRQRKVIMGLIEAYKDLPPDRMLSVLNEILPLITTDMSNAEIVNYALGCFPLLSTADVQTLRIPLDGTFSSGRVEVRPGFYGWFQYNIDFAENKKALREVFYRRD